MKTEEISCFLRFPKCYLKKNVELHEIKKSSDSFFRKIFFKSLQIKKYF